MLAKAKNGHTNILYILLLNFVATYNIRSPTQDSEKEIVLCKKGDDITRFDGTVKWGNIVFGFNIVTSLSKCLSGHISRYNEFISLV